MSIHKISRLIYYVRREYHITSKNFILKTIPDILTKQQFSKRCVANTSTKHRKSLWHSFVTQWEWTVPTGIGVTLLAILQWKHLRKHPYTQNGETQEQFNDFVVKCYSYLPLRITSRIWGWIANIEIPVNLRSTLYGLYAKTFHANLEEVELDLSEFKSLVEFFVRPLKDNVRPIAQNADIVSPADGVILHFGPVTSCRVEQVKGVTYNLRHFLGDMNQSSSSHNEGLEKRDGNDYVKTLLKNPLNQLYQLVVYLAPGDYHRFHSSADWQIEFRRHFQGKLLSVNPKIAKFLPNLFSLNERVVYIGSWIGGFMAYVAVGATNVGSIRVYCDQELTTNTIKWPETKQWQDVNLGCALVNKGQLFGEFRMGSTIVLLFEAPKDFQFCLKVGQKIKVGQALTECAIKPEEKQQYQQVHLG